MIAILEDDKRREMAMREELVRLHPGVEVIFFDNAPDMVAWLKDNSNYVRLFCLDHDLGLNRKREDREFDPGIGRDVADFLATPEPRCPILIHTSNIDGAYGMQFALEGAGWMVEKIAPMDDLSWIKDRWSERVVALIKV